MRVATRRLQAALSLFADVLPENAQSFREELDWIGQALGGVRDLDVQLEQLNGWVAEIPEADREALDALRSLLEDKRRDARAAMLEALDSRRYEAFVRPVRTVPARSVPPANGRGRGPRLTVAPDLIEARFRKLRSSGDRIGPTSEAADLHQLRIHGKRLRYALEFLRDLYPGQTRPLIKRMVVLQDVLGLHQDHRTWRSREAARMAADGAELEPATIFAMGEIAERYRRSMASLRAKFPRAYGRVGQGLEVAPASARGTATRGSVEASTDAAE